MREVSKRRKLAVAACALVLAAGGGLFWAHESARWVSTDNAYVEADTARVMPQTSGFVSEVLVQDNQVVHAGQPLLRLDPADAQANLETARAELARARAALLEAGRQQALQSAQITEQAATVESAHAGADLAQTDLQRFSALAKDNWIAPQRLQTAEAQARQAAAAVSQAEAGLVARRRAVAATQATQAQAAAQVKAAQAQLEAAELALARTTIVAPIDGVVGDLSARLGEAVKPGAQVMALVPLGSTYVVANFKETQVGKLRIGQLVDVKADAFPDAHVQGRVESFAPASGSEFALIPVEHATGNFTKITQRLPVRIELEPDPVAQALRPGLSLKVQVDVRSQGGASFAESAVPEQRRAQLGQ